MSTNKFDIIIAGGGLSGLSLAWNLAKGGYEGEVLVIDSTFAPQNTKTWCFWDKADPPFPEIIFKKWKKTYFSALDFEGFLYMNKYSYYCIRQSDFKEFVLTELKKRKNFTLLEENVLDFSSNKNKAALVTKNSDTYLADYIFQSIFKPEVDRESKYPLVQHFLGFEIKTTIPVFDPATITLMDFDESFEGGVAFMYVLPFKGNRALIEYTVFSQEPLKSKKEYRSKIRTYLKEKYNLEKEDYEVKRKEYGEIPMEDQKYPATYSSKVINLGTMGGFTKPSTGYTFKRVQNYVKILSESLIKGKEPVLPAGSEFRYRYYDLLILHILSNSDKESLKVFRDLFKNNTLDDVFDFLSENTSILEDLKIMSSVPSIPFIKAIGKNLKVK